MSLGWGPRSGLKEIWSVFQDIDLIDILWRQDIDLGAGREIFDYSHRQKESEVDKERSDGRERGDGWRSAGSEGLDRNLLVDGETGESFPAQVTPLGAVPTGVCRGGGRRAVSPPTFTGDLLSRRTRVYLGGQEGLVPGRHGLPVGPGSRSGAGRVMLTPSARRRRPVLAILSVIWQRRRRGRSCGR